MVGRTGIAQYVLAVIGLSISIYLTLYHYAGVPLVCSNSGIIDCASVLNSQYAFVFGVPIAAFGIIFFVVEFAVLYLSNLDAILIWNLIGIGSVAYFIDIERLVGKICIWCTGVHVTVLLLLAISVYEVWKAQKRHKR